MQFGTISVADAEGAILGHAVRAGDLVLRKGRVVCAGDVDALRKAGIAEIVVARLEQGDVDENEAASRIAAACRGDHIRVGAAFAGRSNLFAECHGLALIDTDLIGRLNAIDESVTVATLAPFARVMPRQMVATVKIIPFGVSRESVAAAESLLSAGGAIRIAPFRHRRAALILTTLPGFKPSLLDKARDAVQERLASVDAVMAREIRVPHAVEPLCAAIRDARDFDPILVFGASAITDRRDVIPAALEAAGGRVETFGMPVDPGNLLLTGRLGQATVVGVPGCARSPKLNGFDFVLWRIAANLPVGRTELAAMGVGGLLGEIPTRPQPRDERPAAPAHLPRIAAVVLAAGLSSRMGSNKLLADLGGKPLIRRAVEAVTESAADPVIVVTGHAAEQVTAALAGTKIRLVNNPDFSKGLSSSLKRGLSALPDDADGAVILLGDMPGITPQLVDKLIAAFDPGEGRAICVATRQGRRGNPVLWARRFFPEIMAVAGDTGARHLIGQYEELVCEVEAADDGPVTDIDTPEALEAYRAR